MNGMSRVSGATVFTPDDHRHRRAERCRQNHLVPRAFSRSTRLGNLGKHLRARVVLRSHTGCESSGSITQPRIGAARSRSRSNTTSPSATVILFICTSRGRCGSRAHSADNSSTPKETSTVTPSHINESGSSITSCGLKSRRRNCIAAHRPTRFAARSDTRCI